jgi:hypothetical protein
MGSAEEYERSRQRAKEQGLLLLVWVVICMTGVLLGADIGIVFALLCGTIALLIYQVVEVLRL